jgi:two-component system sensor histidine kinase VanS
LENENFEVRSFTSADEAMKCINAEKIDLAILDVILPGKSGLDMCREIRNRYNFPIIILTAKNTEIDKINGLTLGADDYITKPFLPLELVARVKAQLRRYKRYGNEQKDDDVIVHNGLVLNVKTHECTLNEKLIILTPTEFSILQILCQKIGHVVSAEDLFHQIWKDEYYSKSNNTITVHIRHLREKMGDSFEKPKYIKTIWGCGFFVYLVIGYTVILIYYWEKPFSYLNDILTATSSIYEQDDKSITLPAPLETIENYLNELRSDVQDSKLAVQNAEQRKNDMISYLAHDLKTPLTSIIGYLSLLSDTPDMSMAERAKCVQITIEKAQRLEKMINEFFDITQYNLQQVELEKETIDLYYMLVQLSDEFYPLLSANGNTINLLADENLTIYADPVRLARVFNNILKNAISYSYSNTEIIVTGKKVQSNVIISFQNRGKTIPKEKLTALFDKFFRLDEARTTNTGGAGLGLAIAKDIITLHGGSITAESDNETTTFIVSLPLTEA